MPIHGKDADLNVCLENWFFIIFFFSTNYQPFQTMVFVVHDLKFHVEIKLVEIEFHDFSRAHARHGRVVSKF